MPKYSYPFKPNEPFVDRKTGMTVRYLPNSIGMVVLYGSPKADKVKNSAAVKILKDRTKKTIWKPNSGWGKNLDKLAAEAEFEDDVVEMCSAYDTN